MWAGISFSKKVVEAWCLTLSWSHQAGPVELELRWGAGDSEAAVLERLRSLLASPDLVHEAVEVTLSTGPAPLLPLRTVVAAAGWAAPVRLGLAVHATRACLTGVELRRTAGAAPLSTSLALALWGALEVEHVARLRVGDAGAVAALGDARVLEGFAALRVLNLSHAGLGALPPSIGLLQNLTELRVVGNQLRILPPDVGKLTSLRVLAADSNQLTILPGELRRCEQLEELTLQHNRLTSVLLSFASLRRLSVLHLYDNPLEFLPEISPCLALHHLTVANLRITADPGFCKYKVEFLPPPPSSGSSSGISIALWDSSKQDKLRPIFALMLRRSSGHHPLLAGALRALAEEDPKNRELMARQENGLQQLVLMALNDNPVVVEETCRTLSLLAEHSPALADAVVAADAAAILRLLPSVDEGRQLSTLRLLASLAYSSMKASADVATEPLLASLQALVGSTSGGGEAAGVEGSWQPGEEVRIAALKALGNLAFCADNRRRLERRPGLLQRLGQLAQGDAEPPRVQAGALRVLAVLGQNEQVERAAGKAPISGRGLRILSMDGGGMKGMATVRALRELERHTGRRVWELFDLIVGTSTGGLLAVALGLKKMTLDECEHIYKVLGRKVFSRVVASKDNKEESWMESFYRTFANKTSHVRAVVVGYKHDVSVYEALLREYCDFSSHERCIGNAMIDTAALDAPRVALVSTLSSLSPAPPFVFRNYQLPRESEGLAVQIGGAAGSCKHPVWQAVRASSAASFYLEDFSCGGDKFQDGALTANNPSVVALQEARLLWPDHPIDVMVSLGCGQAPPVRRERASSFLETGSILIESSTNVARAQEALATLLPLVPGVKYFRLCASDPRCAMELDEVDPERWAALEAATDDYLAQPATQEQLAEAAAALLQAGPGAAAKDGPAQQAPGPAAGRLSAGRRRLVVLRAPRLGTAQRPSVDDAVAASLAHRPRCAAVINMQQLSPSSGEAADLQLAAAVAAMAATAGAAGPDAARKSDELQSLSPSVRALPSDPRLDARGQQPASSSQEEVGPEASGLTAYLSSWWGGSPAKHAQLAQPAAAAATSASDGSPDHPEPSNRPAARQASGVVEPAAAGAGSGRGPRQGGLFGGARMPLAPAALSDTAMAAGAAELAAKLEERLEATLPSVGVLHLGLEVAGDAGMVMHWQQQLQVVAEPSQEASSLLAAAGCDDATTRLADLFSQRHSFELPGACTLTVLSSQTQWADGRPLSMLLLSAARPDVLLPASSLGLLGRLLHGQIVVSASYFPALYVSALLEQGAKAVVCRSACAEAEACTDDYCAFFDAFYDALLAGKSLGDSLHAASVHHPHLRHSFAVHA